MHFKSIKFYNFRNINNGIVLFDKDDIILEGMNGQGKTNILESVYTLCYGNSFRTQVSREMIKHGERIMNLSAIIEDEDDIYEVSYSLELNKRKIILNGKEVKDRKELIYLFPCIVFTHDDIDFIKGEPEMRRKFFDQTLSMYDPIYLNYIRSYRNILAQRNAAIKNNQISLLDIYDVKLANLGFEIIKSRKTMVNEFNEIFPFLYKKISGTEKNITVNYRSSWEEKENPNQIIEYLKETHDRDIKLLTTTSGIHRDRFTVNDENGPLVITGSTGQIRLASLLFRIAEARIFKDKTGKDPILLLDDVLLELDDIKRAKFLNELTSYCQAFYTFLPRESYFNEKKESIIEYNVCEGCLNEI
ncbi:MAG: DNA replication and repair protein RecF [Spirochaetales bacterium]|uniref:DNA replication/repair protein RecF n=1 Tax=Bullifex sp. TaxID=2815808 RepID=UPI002A52894D|nr:DNA replication and repair protein RecF [Bullifex sp.]MDD7272073.1 DNA replication and repair protein RecF [Spirochaetales bacterium]MDY4067389.1 DNA replication and repair protein RecF [Bullifex sp.]